MVSPTICTPAILRDLCTDEMAVSREGGGGYPVASGIISRDLAKITLINGRG